MRMKRIGGLLLVLAAVMCIADSARAEEGKAGGVINVATIGEPPTLDPVISTADVVGMITQHFYETLYTFGKGYSIKPLLAVDMPRISDDAKTYTIALRQGVRFHNGKEMTSADVVASLKRYLSTATRGKQIAELVESIEGPDKYTVVITLRQPHTPLLALLSMNNSAAIIVPAELAGGDLTQHIGTGPYKFVEHQPDRYIRLVRNDDYTPRDDAADLYGGKRVAWLDEIRFIPVPSPNTRIEGALAGQYQYADQIPVESYDRLLGSDKIVPEMVAAYGWPVIFVNTKEGLMSDVAIRRAFQAALSESDMMAAAFGEPEFYQVDGDLYPEGYFYNRKEGTELYDQGDPEKAAAMLKRAGYDGSPVRVLVSMQYEFHFKLAQVMAEYLKMAGFKVDMQVVDWATLTQRRADPKLWDVYFTHTPFVADPSLNNIFNDSAPGWWVNPEKTRIANAFNSEADLKKRAEIFGQFQELIYNEAVMVKVGNFNLLGARANAVHGFIPSSWPSFWNVWLD